MGKSEVLVVMTTDGDCWLVKEMREQATHFPPNHSDENNRSCPHICTQGRAAWAQWVCGLLHAPSVASASSSSPLASAAPLSHPHPGHPTIAAVLRLLQRNLKAKRSGILSLLPRVKMMPFKKNNLWFSSQKLTWDYPCGKSRIKVRASAPLLVTANDRQLTPVSTSWGYSASPAHKPTPTSTVVRSHRFGPKMTTASVAADDEVCVRVCR